MSGSRVDFNALVKSDVHIQEVFVWLVEMTPCFHIDKLVSLSHFFSLLSFSWCEYVLHLHHSLFIRGHGHLRGSSAYIADGSRLVRMYFLPHIPSQAYYEIQ